MHCFFPDTMTKVAKVSLQNIKYIKIMSGHTDRRSICLPDPMHCFFQCSSDTMTTVTKVSLSLVSDLKEGYCKFSSFLIRACLHKRFKKNIWAQSYGPKNGGRAGLTEKLLSSHHHLNHLHYHNNKPETLGTLVG